MKTFAWSRTGVVAAALVGCICCSLASTAAEDKSAQSGKIEAAKPRYVSKDQEAWKSQGRIVGIAKLAPGFTVTILTTNKQEVATVKAEPLKEGSRAYEIWLKPGVYIMVVSAGGYESLDIKDLEVKTGNDLRIDLEFSKVKK
jgi:hypothetical protein